jgi:hypothetical protein
LACCNRTGAAATSFKSAAHTLCKGAGLSNFLDTASACAM